MIALIRTATLTLYKNSESDVNFKKLIADGFSGKNIQFCFNDETWFIMSIGFRALQDNISEYYILLRNWEEE